MGEATGTKDPTNSERVKRWRVGKRPVNVWLPSGLVERIHAARRAQRRSLTTFVEIALEGTVDMAEKYDALQGPGRKRR